MTKILLLACIFDSTVFLGAAKGEREEAEGAYRHQIDRHFHSLVGLPQTPVESVQTVKTVIQTVIQTLGKRVQTLETVEERFLVWLLALYRHCTDSTYSYTASYTATRKIRTASKDSTKGF